MPLTKNRSYAVSAAQLRRTIFRSDRDVFVEPLSLRPSHYTAGRQDRNQSRQILEPIESRVILTWLVFFLLLVCMLEMRAVVQNTHTRGTSTDIHHSVYLRGESVPGVLGPRRSPATTKTTLEKLMIVYDQGSFFAQEFEVSC